MRKDAQTSGSATVILFIWSYNLRSNSPLASYMTVGSHLSSLCSTFLLCQIDYQTVVRIK